ncbi:hypothetical protein C4D60_Mb09t18950 [Musa balbisiana]|uniref:Uncharacterized protein n=1 Tax=Musa balbisiana TaxID=52838 RepID=A0A4S8IHI7_MUSBA|nr:hypothetical protein C4D60_Mb09t18950 [Musa balbisiana]
MLRLLTATSRLRLLTATDACRYRLPTLALTSLHTATYDLCPNHISEPSNTMIKSSSVAFPEGLWGEILTSNPRPNEGRLVKLGPGFKYLLMIKISHEFCKANLMAKRMRTLTEPSPSRGKASLTLNYWCWVASSLKC